ncbi:hypothetical protein [Actinomycetospora cinnamomea]|uniref:Uncharacterized protein n=1 Tax=Actinomycetospora cinnamomea TaxID=663609 RepID=A0A2U1F283_9PSEU|nr:hypothetical protein [Actinomycetospora cinnamomea]PVZ06278.1 hypothetical protein C8D89_11316 [Actinomycetospora cinnamomea]
MSKRLVTQLFVGSLVGAVGGFVVLLVAGGLAWGGGVFVMRGPDVVGVRSTPAAWVALVLTVLGALVLLAAALTQFIAWIGAVLDAAGLSNTALLIVLLVTGLLSFGLVGMIVYLVLAPADDAPERRSDEPGAGRGGVLPAPEQPGQPAPTTAR